MEKDVFGQVIPETLIECQYCYCGDCTYKYLLDKNECDQYIHETCPVRKLLKKIDTGLI